MLIAGAGWNANHWRWALFRLCDHNCDLDYVAKGSFHSVYGFPGRSDISSAIGAFVVAFIGTLWGKYFQSTAFIVSVTGACCHRARARLLMWQTLIPSFCRCLRSGIMFQLPSGLGNGGLLAVSGRCRTTCPAVYSLHCVLLT